MFKYIKSIWLQKTKYYIVVFACLIFLTIPSLFKMLVKELHDKTDIY